MKRVSFFIDGFNIYHSLLSAHDDDPEHKCFKWFDLKKYVSLFLTEEQTLNDIHYFSAIYKWSKGIPPTVDDSKEMRHKILKAIYTDQGIRTYFGRFQMNKRYCQHSKSTVCYRAEEKETDVHIGVSIMKEGIKNTFDTACLVSGDTDFLPIIKSFKEVFPEKVFGIIFPYKRGKTAMSLKKEAHFFRKTRLEVLSDCILPDPYFTKDGKKYYRPPEWE